MKWKKPNGNEIETNDLKATVEHCESLGWIQAGKSPAKLKSVPKKSKKVVIKEDK